MISLNGKPTLTIALTLLLELCVIIDDQLKWQAHINYSTNSVGKTMCLLPRLRYFSNAEECRTFGLADIMS